MKKKSVLSSEQVITSEQCPSCPWDVTTNFSLTDGDEYLSAHIGKFALTLNVPKSLMKNKWSLRDMNSHTTEPNINVHTTYHFEITVDPPVPVDKVKGLLSVSFLGPRKNNKSGSNEDFTMRLSGKPENFDNCAPFRSWVDGMPQRIYEFRLTHEAFYIVDLTHKLKPLLFQGVAFTVQNCHVRENFKNPDWRLVTDAGDFMKRVISKRYKGLDRTPIRPDYGVELKSWQRAQGAPFWEMYRKGRIDQDEDNGTYMYLTREKFKELGGTSKLKRCGGSGAYKWAGKFVSDKPDKPIESNRKMRLGSILEEPVMLALLLDSPDDLNFFERGWVDYPTPTEDELRDGVSPDGILFDQTMTTSILPEYRRKKWEDQGWVIDDENNTVGGAKFTKGLLEIKVSEADDDMRDYYRIQCIWAMRILNVYWTRLVKLHTTGVCRSYLMYRDLDRENELIGLINKTQARIGPNCTLVQSLKHTENRQWLKKMWGSAKWFNEHKDLASKTVRWDKPEIKAYFTYLKNARSEIALSFEDLERRPQRKDLFPTKRRHVGEEIEEKIQSLEKAHGEIIQTLALPSGFSNETISSLIRHNVAELLALMETALSK